MFKRLFWLTVGAMVGFTGSVWAQKKVKRALERYLPERMAQQMQSSAKTLGKDLKAAATEGRAAAREREASLRANLRP